MYIMYSPPSLMPPRQSNWRHCKMLCWSNSTHFYELSRFDCRICVQFQNSHTDAGHPDPHTLVDWLVSKLNFMWHRNQLISVRFVYMRHRRPVVVAFAQSKRWAHLWLYCAIILNWKSFTWHFLFALKTHSGWFRLLFWISFAKLLSYLYWIVLTWASVC